MSSALLRRIEHQLKAVEKPRLCALNPSISLIGKLVYVTKCHARVHGVDDGSCVCKLINEPQIIWEVRDNGIHVTRFNDKNYYLRRGEFLPKAQYALKLNNKVKLVKR